MKRPKFIWLLSPVLILCVLGSIALADMPPDPGFKRVSTSVVLETNEDFKDYRFFVVSGDIAREVFLRKGEKTRVDSIGGGSRYRGGTIVAISAKSLEPYGETPDALKLREMQEAIARGGVAGRIDLIQHQFVQDIRNSEAGDVSDDSYRIDRTRGALIAVPLTVKNEDRPKQSGLSSGITDINKNVTPFGIATVAAGVLMTLSVVIFGLWFMTRRTNKRI